MWYRVFGGAASPEPAALLEHLHTSGFPVVARFHGDDLGWFRVQLTSDDGEPLVLERYLTAEDDIRDDLNTWAAWLETASSGPEQVRLMEHVIGTKQLFTLLAADDEANDLCECVCRYLARTTGGVWQVDGRGFFDADGRLLVSEQDSGEQRA